MRGEEESFQLQISFMQTRGKTFTGFRKSGAFPEQLMNPAYGATIQQLPVLSLIIIRRTAVYPAKQMSAACYSG